uniref:HTH psq-type domain-containing protein n=1 Tax=Macrostomum lignano TaxID=282301 RepID=A0A1I8HVZ7_9PLAT
KERSEEAKRVDVENERRDVRFIAKLKETMNNIRKEEIVIQTRFNNARELCTADVPDDEESMRTQYINLDFFIADVEVLGCLAKKKQAEVFAKYKNKFGLTTEETARRLDTPVKFGQRLFTFHGLLTKFPNILFSGYSMETLLTFKKTIEKEEFNDENFRCKLETEFTIIWEGEDEDERSLLEETEEKMEKFV